MTPEPELTDAEVEELLGAYALDACDPDEVAAVEAVLARRPDLAAEAARLARVVVWLGATDATPPPPAMRSATVEAALARRPSDPALESYVALMAAFADAVERLPAGALDAITPNGLSAHDLVVHMAAQESLLAQHLGVPTVDDLHDDDTVARTHALIPRFAARDVDDALALWRASVAANRSWARSHREHHALVPGLGLTRDDTLLAHAFEAWMHADDLHGAGGLDPVRPDVVHLAAMSDLARRAVPLALAAAGREHPGRTVRLVLTGEGGGDALVAMHAGEAGSEPDVTVVADVVDWCLRLGDRLPADGLRHEVTGDQALARDLVVAASALATL